MPRSRNQPHGIAVDSTGVYWSDDTGGTVMKVAVAGGPAVTLASVQAPVRIAVDATNVYWGTNLASGSIMRVAK